MEQQFERNLYMKMMGWIYLFLVSNLCFWLMNVPFIVTALFLAIDERNLAVFAVALSFVGVGGIALVALLEEVIKEKEMTPVRVYRQKLKQFGWRGYLYWLMGWTGSIVAFADGLFFLRFPFGRWLSPFFFLLGVMSLSLSLNCWYFQVRNPLAKKKDVLRIALYYTFKKWYVSLINVLLLLLLFVCVILKPPFGISFGPMAIFGLVYFNQRKFVGRKISTIH